MRKAISIILCFLLCSPAYANKDLAKRFPSDTAMEVYTPNNPPPGGSGTVTSVSTDSTLTGGPITTSGTLGIANNAAIPGNPTTTTQSANDNSTKIATTAYVDNAVLAQNYKEAVNLATTANLVGTYSNGSSGIGATFTYTATGVDAIDGTNLTLGMRVLLKNQTTTFQNGIYTVTLAGALGVAGVLTRATDFNQSSEIKTGDAVFVVSGTAQASTTWVYTGIDSPTMGTTAITFVQIAGQGSFTGSNGVQVSGTTVSGINAAADGSTKGVATFTATDFTSSSGVISGILTKVATASPSSSSAFTLSGLSTSLFTIINLNLIQNTTSGAPKVTFNSDNNTDYAYVEILSNTGSSVGGNYLSANNYVNLVYATGTLTVGATVACTIFLYPSSASTYSAQYNMFCNEDSNGFGMQMHNISGRWNKTGGITDFTVTAAAGTLSGTATAYQYK